jgi:hypothetical protein
MSFKTWKAEFYPRRPSTRMSRLAAAEHSLRKWLGLRPHALTRHGVDFTEATVGEGNKLSDILYFDATSCALCVKFQGEAIPSCVTCPLFQVRGKVPCDDLRDDETLSPYHKALVGDPEPMIAWLRKTVAYVKRQAAKKPRPAR